MRSDKGPWSKFEPVPPRWVKRRESLDTRSVQLLERSTRMIEINLKKPNKQPENKSDDIEFSGHLMM